MATWDGRHLERVYIQRADGTEESCDYVPDPDGRVILFGSDVILADGDSVVIESTMTISSE